METSLNVLLGTSANILLVWLEELGIVNETHKKYLLPKIVQTIVYVQPKIMKELPCALRQFMLENGLLGAHVQI